MDMPKADEWKIKKSEDGAPIIDGTKVVFIAPDGKELPLDPPSMYQKIADLNIENKKRRETAEGLQGTVALFEGIEDIPTWKSEADKALETVANFNDKDWMKADKVEKLKSDMTESYNNKLEQHKNSFNEALATKDGVIKKKDSQIHGLLVSNNFAIHPLFGGSNPKTKLTPELAEAYFGKYFRLEENSTGELNLVPYHDPGKFENPVYSRENPGDIATFSEAMETIWDKFPSKDSLMTASSSGSGSGGGTGDDVDIDDTDLSSLKSAHKKALKDGNAKMAISLKRRIFDLQQKVNQR
jgi:hypothetical protein